VTKHSLSVELYVGLGKQKVHLQSWSSVVDTTDTEINAYGSIWGERQVLNLGSHFNIYSQYKASQWGIANQLGLFPLQSIPTMMNVASSKLPGGSVSGNFGEVLTVLALQAKVPPRKQRALRVGHLCPKPGHANIKCPDLLIETEPIRKDYDLYRTAYAPDLPELPELIPGECKNDDHLGAMRQIVSFWGDLDPFSSGFGFGLISSISYANPPSIRFNLLVCEDDYQLYCKMTSAYFNPERVVIADMKGCLHGF
jgi:hypothetical protein